MHPTAAIVRELIDCNGNPLVQSWFFEVEEWGWRYWRMLNDTPYTQGENDLAGWNSYEDNLKGKQAFTGDN